MFCSLTKSGNNVVNILTHYGLMAFSLISVEEIYKNCILKIQIESFTDVS